MQTADDHDGQLRGRPSSSSGMQTADDPALECRRLMIQQWDADG